MTHSSSASKVEQTTSHLVMVRPVAFGYNEETAADNAFMKKDDRFDFEALQTKAQAEFDEFVAKLRGVGIQVTVFDDLQQPVTPDAVFPNNWISSHRSGKVIVYPMTASSRRLERRQDIIDFFLAQHAEVEFIDLREYEQQDLFLEGTGSMVMDRQHQIAYASVSPRTSPALFELFCEKLGCEGQLFHGTDRQGQPIYHTNVLMALGQQMAVICLESLKDDKERQRITNRLQETGHEIIEITFDQMEAFAGNMLEVYNEQGEAWMIMSQRAYNSLEAAQLAQIEQYAQVLWLPPP